MVSKMESILLKFQKIPLIADMGPTELPFLTEAEARFLSSSQGAQSAMGRWKHAISMKRATENFDCGYQVAGDDDGYFCKELGFRVVGNYAFHPTLLLAELFVYQDILKRIADFSPRNDKYQLNLNGLTTEQRLIVDIVSSSPISLLLGGPGTGKSHVAYTFIQSLINDLNISPSDIAVLGATNGSCKPYSSLSCKVSTVHKALEFNPISLDFKRNQGNRLNLKYVFVEEASLLDLIAFHALLSALPHSCQIVLIGDPDQIGSCGPGDVLFDLHLLGFVPQLKLSHNHRNSADVSQLCAHIRGETKAGESFRQIHFISGEKNPDKYYEKFLKILYKLEEAGIDTLNDLQILSPKYKGVGGINQINELLHRIITGGNTGQLLSGDKVLLPGVVKSTPSGEIGLISDISRSSALVRISNHSGVKAMNVNKSSGLELAFALSIHKSQGSEFSDGIICLWKDDLSWLGYRGVITAASRFKNSITFYGDVSLSDLSCLGVNHRNTLAKALNYDISSLSKLVSEH